MPTPAGGVGPAPVAASRLSATDADCWGVPLQPGERRVLRRGRRRWLRTVASLVRVVVIVALVMMRIVSLRDS